MAELRDWKETRNLYARLLKEGTGQDAASWRRRVEMEGFDDEKGLRAWLAKRGVAGYAQDFLVMERFGYPKYMTATADELIEGQYADRPHLRPILEVIIEAADRFSGVAIQARKTYVSLVSPRRTFARVQPTTKERLDLGLRLAGVKPAGRLQASRIHETMKVQIGLTSPEEIDSEVLNWLKRAYQENR